VILLLVGAFNWGCVGLFDFDVIRYVFEAKWLVRVLYVLIGFSGIYQVVYWSSIKGRWIRSSAD
jgi:uncharacterized membrane protein YuzA (DUF378 family)